MIIFILLMGPCFFFIGYGLGRNDIEAEYDARTLQKRILTQERAIKNLKYRINELEIALSHAINHNYP